MPKLAALLLFGASVALVVAAEAATPSPAPAISLLDNCICTCPSKPVASQVSGAEPTSRKKRQISDDAQLLQRHRRFVFGFNPKVSYSTVKELDNSRDMSEGDTAFNSNNGGNTQIKQGTGSMLGSGNEGQFGSQGAVGGSLGNINADQGIWIGK